MTRFTVSSKAPAMGIIVAVAGIAILRRTHVRFAGFRMTRLANQALMPAAERKVGLGAVIEDPDIPSVGVVATPTPRAQRALMGVILAVTFHAGCLCIVELGAGVAVLASHDCV